MTRRSRLRMALWTAALMLALGVAAVLATPPLLKWQAEQQLSRRLGRSVQIGEVRVSLATLAATLTDARIAAAAGAPPEAAPLLQLARLHVDLALWPLLRGQPAVERLEVDAPRVHLARSADGRWSIDDVVATLRATAPPPDPAAEPLRFVLQNLQLRDGSLEFDDGVVGRTARVDALELSLPRLSSHPGQVDEAVEAALAGRLDGTAFRATASGTPLAASPRGRLTLGLDGLDIEPYLGHLPAGLPLRPSQGKVSAALVAELREAPDDWVASGTLAARDVALVDARGRPGPSWQALQVELKALEMRPRQLTLGTVRLDGARVALGRDARGALQWPGQGAAAGPAAATPRPGGGDRGSTIPAAAVPSAASAPASAATPAPAPGLVASTPQAAPAPSGSAPRPAAGDAAPAAGWTLQVARVDLGGARLRVADETRKPALTWEIEVPSASAQQLRWPNPTDMPVKLDAKVRPGTAAAGSGALLQATGMASDRAAELALQLDGLDLASLQPYLRDLLVPRLDGRLDARATLRWRADPDTLTLQVSQATLAAMRLTHPARRTAVPLASWQRLVVDDADVDLNARRVALGRVTLTQPTLAIARDGDGRIDAAAWLRSAAASPPATAKAPTPRANARRTVRPAEPSWQLELRQLAMRDGRLRWTDAAASPDPSVGPAAIELRGVRADLRGLAWPATARTPALRLQLRTQVASAATGGTPALGTAGWSGRVTLAPLGLDGRLDLQRLPVALFTPYVDHLLPVRLTRAEAGYTGRIALRQARDGWTAVAQGDALVGDLHVTTRPETDTEGLSRGAENELLSWQALALRRIDFAAEPGQRPRLGLGEVEASDLYASLLVDERGRFNLQGLARRAAPTTDAAAAADASPSPAAGPQESSPGVSPVADASVSALPLDLVVERTLLNNGRVDFADRYIQPNYSATLTELTGELGTVRSDLREMAALQVRGRIAGTGLLEISGQLNPTVAPPQMDLRARASDIELPPLSPYAGKYAGYAIERGKLSVAVAYRIEPDGRLEASNQLVLNQLTFGERIESPSATKLPVLLAVALLKDRHGVIDIDLPIRGSLNDPQFSLGGIVVKLIVNLLVKAITAPFTLLFGSHGQDLSVVEFAPGLAQPGAGSDAALDKVAQALRERPALTMTVTGSADPVLERADVQREVLEARLRAERRRERLREGAPADEVITLTPQDRDRLLEDLYRKTDLPDKPRNALGLVRRLPPAQMEALLRQHVRVDDALMQQLALQRATAVRDALIARGLPSERLFLAAPKLHGPEGDAASWKPSAQLSLSMR